jgi:hypothetical protein
MDQEFLDWLTRCQDEDATFLQEASTIPPQPVRGKGGRPTGEFLPSPQEGIALIEALHGEKKMPRAKTQKRAEPPDNGPDMDLVRQKQRSAEAIMAPMDALAHEMEQKWGYGRLQTLVPPEWAMKWHSAFEKLNLAIAKGDLVELRERCEIMMRGYKKLDELATEAGHPTHYNPKVWEAVGDSGRVYAICQTPLDERNARLDKDVRIITLKEVIKIIEAWDADGLITELRAQFPGSEIVKAGRKPDTIHPDDLPDAGI